MNSNNRNSRIIQERLQKDDYKCQNCSCEENLQVHHIVPLANGGRDKINNTITLCEKCHKSIHASNNTLLNQSTSKWGKEKTISPEKKMCFYCHNECDINTNECPRCGKHSFITGQKFDYDRYENK